MPNLRGQENNIQIKLNNVKNPINLFFCLSCFKQFSFLNKHDKPNTVYSCLCNNNHHLNASSYKLSMRHLLECFISRVNKVEAFMNNLFYKIVMLVHDKIIILYNYLYGQFRQSITTYNTNTCDSRMYEYPRITTYEIYQSTHTHTHTKQLK